MKLTIDTKEDSKEEIKKAIRMLSAIVGDSEIYTNRPAEKQHNSNIFSNDQPETESSGAANAFANMFGAVSSQPTKAETTEETSEDSEEKPEVQIVEY